MPKIPVFGRVAKPSKYHAVRTTYNGISYASKAEAEYAGMLDLLQRAGKIGWWLGQVKFRLGLPENVYVADFLVIEAAPVEVHAVDVKGVKTAKFNRDVRLWKAYGPCPLHIVSGHNLEIITPIKGEPES